MTPREIILLAGRRAFQKGLINKKEVKDLAGGERAYFRALQLFNGAKTQGVQTPSKEADSMEVPE